MANANDTASMALFCDFENIALGVRDAQYEKFDIKPVLERLLAKGSIVVKKAYCDWERYKGFKSGMHEANFELIEIPHVRQSGKNSADIRMVVDALDLCYTKAHVDTFVIISGDSDFSPLVSKLRENAKKVIGVGVKQSCSDLLVTNCDEFIYYDDLVRDREAQRTVERREREKRSPEEEARRREKIEERKTRAVELAAATFADMIADRGDSERIWASVLKEVIKRRNPGFNESYFGFRSFGNLLEEAAGRGLLAVGRDEKSGTYVMRAVARPQEGASEPALPLGEPLAVDVLQTVETGAQSPAPEAESSVPAVAEKGASRRRGGRRSRKESESTLPAGAVAGDAGVATPGESQALVMREESAGMVPAAVDAVAAEISETGASVAPAGEGSESLPPATEAAPRSRRGGGGRRPRKAVEALGEASASAPPAGGSEAGGAATPTEVVSVPVAAEPAAEPATAAEPASQNAAEDGVKKGTRKGASKAAPKPTIKDATIKEATTKAAEKTSEKTRAPRRSPRPRKPKAETPT